MKCMTCGMDEHGFKCPLIKSYEYFQEPDEQGCFRVRRIEFVTYADLQPQPALATLPAHGTRQ